VTGSIRGTDGKQYPSSWLPAADRAYLVDLVHRMHCAERLSVRKLLDRIEELHGIRRSVGWAAGVLKTQRCDRCSGDPSGTPEQQHDLTGADR
jgi:hypothetical protein